MNRAFFLTSPRSLVDAFKRKFGLVSDGEAAKVLGVPGPHLSGYVTGSRPMPMGLKFRLLEHTGFSSETGRFAELFMGANEFKVAVQDDLDRLDEIRQSRGRQIKTVGASALDLARLSRLQESLGVDDASLASMLGLDLSILEGVRSGGLPIPVHAKAALLDRLK